MSTRDDARSKEATIASEAPRRKRHPLALGFAALGLVLLGVLAARLWMSPAPSTPGPVMRLTVPIPPSQGMDAGDTFPVISRDGSQIAYVADQQLYLRRLSEERARSLEGTEDAGAPFFSPDGQWIGFFRNHRLEKVSVDGGPPVTVAEVNFPLGASWGFDDTIVLSDGGSLYRVPASGGTPELLVKAAEGELATYPQLLPDGSAVLYAEVGRAGLH
jgi:Tol biopolymer transport system component